LGSPSRAARAKDTPNRDFLRAERHTMIHPSLIAIGALVLVFGILNLIEFKRLD
jgi:hypothetical protein